MQKRIIISILLSVSIILLSLGFISSHYVEHSIERSYEERLTQAMIIATSVDRSLEQNITRLYDVSLAAKIDLRDDTWLPEQDALRTAYQYSIFADGVFLLNRRGDVILSYPPREGWSMNLPGVPTVDKVIADMRPFISGVITLEPSRRKVVLVLVPLRNRNGDVVGAAGGLVDPTSYYFMRILESLALERNTHADLVDIQGTVIASNDPGSILTGIDHNKFLSKLIAARKNTVANCHRCHLPGPDDRQQRSEDILVFAPLNLAPWGVALRFPKDQVHAPSAALRSGFFLIGIVALVTSFVLALGMSRSIVRPVQQLIRETDRIAGGDLKAPVEIESTEEISTLSQHFDDMRMKLAASLESIQRQNLELEQRVRERTRQLMEKQVMNETLLRKLITSQEDERKRIARELHDESLQTLAALLMNIEMCRLHPDLITPEKVNLMRDTVTRVINEMTKVIQNLRPTVLDDLGFEAGIVWLIDRNLRDRGITCHADLQELVEDRLSPELQVTLFRIFQEATMNIARHAEAKNVYIRIRNDDKLFSMTVEDDGKGFDTESLSVFENSVSGRGLGTLGMQERAAQVNGLLKIYSVPGQGTTVLCTVPLTREG